jgi:hypothetical protein
MNIPLGVQEASLLGEKAAALEMSARTLSAFAEQDPETAAECGVEVNALEARTILSGGAAARISGKCAGAARSGRPVQVDSADLEALGRLEGVLALGASRIGQKVAALDAAHSQEGMAKLGSIIGLATGAVGLWKSII